jgi:cysteine-rich repeat protein
MGSNQMRLQCASAVCGNGAREVSEQCDDGNTAECDGCSPSCRLEACGDGIVQCGEQCDEGAANGSTGNRCSSACAELPPALRVPGGGSRRLDCGLEFSAEIDPSTVPVARNGVPKPQLTCIDGSPTCDADATPGTCRIRLWACAGGGDPRIECSPSAIGARAILSPPASATGSLLRARLGLVQALSALPLPAGPGETCTPRIDLDVPVGGRGLVIRSRVHRSDDLRVDTDSLKLRCVTP